MQLVAILPLGTPRIRLLSRRRPQTFDLGCHFGDARLEPSHAILDMGRVFVGMTLPIHQSCETGEVGI